MESKLYHYKATVINIVDGDTLDATVKIGFHLTTRLRFRLYQDDGFYFDTPETKKYRGVSEEHKEHGLKAKARAEELLMGKEIILHTYKEGSFRWLGEVFFKNDNNEWVSYAETMIKEGFQKKDKYDDEK